MPLYCCLKPLQITTDSQCCLGAHAARRTLRGACNTSHVGSCKLRRRSLPLVAFGGLFRSTLILSSSVASISRPGFGWKYVEIRWAPHHRVWCFCDLQQQRIQGVLWRSYRTVQIGDSNFAEILEFDPSSASHAWHGDVSGSIYITQCFCAEPSQAALQTWLELQ